MMSFLNIGFSHNIKTGTTSPPKDAQPIVAPFIDPSEPLAPGEVVPQHVRYLVCAGCEQGPR